MKGELMKTYLVNTNVINEYTQVYVLKAESFTEVIDKLSKHMSEDLILSISVQEDMEIL